MKRSVGLWSLMGYAASTLGGTLLHFLYDWLGGAVWIAPFSGINESTWEHMKLLFWPMLLFAVVQSFFFSERTDFWCVKLRSILFGLALIPVLFYTFNGVIGTSPDWINILIFFVSAAIVFLFEMRAFSSDAACSLSKRASIFILCVIAVLFVLFTFAAPEIGIFRDPLTGTFGI